MASTSCRRAERVRSRALVPAGALVASVVFLALVASCASPIARRPGTSSDPAAAVASAEVSPPPGIALETTCVSTGHELCFDATDNNCNGLIDEGCGVNSGVLQVAASWGEEEADVDLLVTDPGGDLVKAGSPAGSGLVKDRDCPGPDRRCRGQNMENVFLEPDAEPVRGPYRVTVKLEKLNGARLPIKVRVGARIGPRVYGFSTELVAQGQEQTFTFRL